MLNGGDSVLRHLFVTASPMQTGSLALLAHFERQDRKSIW